MKLCPLCLACLPGGSRKNWNSTVLTQKHINCATRWFYWGLQESFCTTWCCCYSKSLDSFPNYQTIVSLNHKNILNMIASRSTILLAFIACALVAATSAFAPANTGSLVASRSAASTTAHMSFDDFGQETPEDTKERIQELVDNNPVLLFMKGSKLFPQCGFSNTACQILQSYDIDFHSVDVLSDEAIRQGVKDFSMWPTIPQLYVVRRFLCFGFLFGSNGCVRMDISIF